MWGIHVTAVNHVMQPGQVSSRDNFLLLLWLYSISWCCAGMSTTESFISYFTQLYWQATGHHGDQSLQACSVAVNVPESCGGLRWMQLTNTNEAECSLQVFVILYFRNLRLKSWSDLISRWIERDRMMTGEDQAAAAAASSCSLCRRFCERNSIWWMWNNIWKFAICTLVLVNCVMSKLTQGTYGPKASSQYQGLTMTCERWSAPNEPFFPPRMLHTYTHLWCLHWR